MFIELTNLKTNEDFVLNFKYVTAFFEVGDSTKIVYSDNHYEVVKQSYRYIAHQLYKNGFISCL